MVRTHHCVAVVEQGLHNGTEVGHALAAVAEPCTAIDMDDDRIALGFLFRQIDVAGMISLVITGIVDVLPLLGSLQFRLLLETAKASSGLCHGTYGSQTHHEC